ncbi:glucose-1-phosphate thymidylyltransferase [Taibaiella sp. KBW10]|uniref:GlmU family protein n=1 Tax=Taibaiella sp. KBW10 TaxID=2153357 RepID=UPI000F5B337C|nr:GlmU family protein [Taibaiella sp. KBW10]RQO31888.1 glucose-1-phosphate thymidylyltransferase [Taibaiella sp. KBW10]
MNLILFDTQVIHQLLPFTHTRPIADIRCGILTMRGRWELYLQAVSSTVSVTPLQEVFPVNYTEDNLYVNAQVFATPALGIVISNLNPGQALIQDETIIALRSAAQLDFEQINKASLKDFEPVLFGEPFTQLQNAWDIFSLNDYAIRADFAILTHQKTAQPIPEEVTLIGKAEDVFIEAGAVVSASILNAKTGPIYIAKDAEIMEGCMLRGPLALGEHAVIKMGAKIYGATTIGAGSKVGGEISNTVFFDNANKGHDGFVGNAVIGEWCNLGADTNSSNLKNNYDEVSIWSEYEDKMVKTGLQFCGLLMGDHSKCGINTMFNTGTVVGVSCNIYGGDFPDKYIPSFSWGGKNDTVTYRFDKAIDTANRMMARRGKSLSVAETTLLKYIFDNKKTL